MKCIPSGNACPATPKTTNTITIVANISQAEDTPLSRIQVSNTVLTSVGDRSKALLLLSVLLEQ